MRQNSNSMNRSFKKNRQVGTCPGSEHGFAAADPRVVHACVAGAIHLPGQDDLGVILAQDISHWPPVVGLRYSGGLTADYIRPGVCACW